MTLRFVFNFTLSILMAATVLPVAGATRKPEPPAGTIPVPVPPLSPEDSRQKIRLQAGYEVELVAAEPLLLDPVAFDWDERGRMWVVEMADYPLGMDGNGQAGGRIRILEDVNGDGVYERSSVFAEGLSFPTGILTWRDGCLITAAPDILLLRDSDGDGLADVRSTLFTGFNPGNQQLRVNGLRWGLDGWIYCANGGHHVNYGKDVSITSSLTGEKIALGARDFRFKPDTGEFDPLSGPAQFGRTRDAWGRWFGVQNSYPLWHYALEDRYLRRNPHVAPPNPRVLLTESNPRVYPAIEPEKRYHNFGQAGRFTSACGPLIVADPRLFGLEASPDTEHAMVCEPFHNLVQHLVLNHEGNTFEAARAPGEKLDFFASEDRWCRPVMVRTGPDGALWVADMYRYMIEHPQWLPASGQQELMPHYRAGDDRGRMYRVFHQSRPPAAVLRLDALDAGALVSLLESPNGWLRDKAQMMIQWRGEQSVVPMLEQLARSRSKPLARVHALHALENLGALSDDVLVAAFNDAHPGVREQSLVIAERHPRDRVIAAAVELADDPDAKVRLQLACSLGEWPQRIAGEALARLANRDSVDPLLQGAVVSSILPHLSAFTVDLHTDDELIDALLQTALGEQQDEVILALLEPPLAAATATNVDSLRRARTGLAFLRKKEITLEALAAKNSHDPRWRSVVKKKDNLLAEVQRALPDAPLAMQAIYATLLLSDPSTQSAALPSLGRLLAPGHGLPLGELVNHLARVGDPSIPELLLQHWTQRTPGERAVILDAIMSRESWVPGLLELVHDGRIPASSIDAQRQARLLKHPTAGIRRDASKVFSVSGNRSRMEVIEAFQPALTLSGDASTGKAVFAQVCAACHQLEGTGLPLGPDLRSVVDHPAEKLLSSILDPNADIQPGFAAYFCELKNGEQLYGSIASETGGSLSFRLADGSTRAVVRSDIKTLQSSNVSLMPDGLEASLTPQSLADLIAYLKRPK